jgi:hypothetical protein
VTQCQNKENQISPTNNSNMSTKLHSIQTPSRGPPHSEEFMSKQHSTALESSSDELGA